MDLFQLELTICWLISLLLAVESIVFELNEYDRNRIVFAGESNINMTCSAPDVVNPLIEIRHGGTNVEDINNEFEINRGSRSLEVTITHVNLNHTGTYECQVSSTQSVINTSILILNVRVDSTVQCLQSGTTLIKIEGGLFALYCYFAWFSPGSVSPYNYTWVATNSSSSSSLTGPADILEGSVKGAIIANVGPLELSDTGTVYSCEHPMEERVGRGMCEIGPIVVNPRMMVSTTDQTTSQRMNTQPSGSSTSGPGSSLTTASTNEQPTSTTDNVIIPSTTKQGLSDDAMLPVPGTTNSTNDSLTIIIISSAAAIAIIVSIAVLLFLVCCCRRKQTKEIHEQRAKLNYELTDNPIYGSDTEDGHKPRPQSSVSDGPRANDESKTFKPQQQDETSLDVVPAVHHYGRDSIQDEFSYDKVNNGNPVGNSKQPKREVQKGSHKYDAPPSRGGAAQTTHYDNPIPRRVAERGSHKYDDPPGTGSPDEETPYDKVKNPVDGGHSKTDIEGKVKSTVDFNQLYSVVKKKRGQEDDGDEATLY